jgi:hypothetical protein
MDEEYVRSASTPVIQGKLPDCNIEHLTIKFANSVGDNKRTHQHGVTRHKNVNG